jgi:hypothetical protein
MKLGTVSKQPAERFSYTIDYTTALTTGDNVESVTVVADPAGLTIDNIATYDPKIKFWAEGGTTGIKYKVTTTVTTADGRVFQDEIFFKIKEI